MKRKINKVNTDEFFEAIAAICKEYNEKHKNDPIVEVRGHFKFKDSAKTIVLVNKKP